MLKKLLDQQETYIQELERKNREIREQQLALPLVVQAAGK
jgi:hypothetical protein